MGILRLEGTLVLSLRESRLRHREIMKMLESLAVEEGGWGWCLGCGSVCKTRKSRVGRHGDDIEYVWMWDVSRGSPLSHVIEHICLRSSGLVGDGGRTWLSTILQSLSAAVLEDGTRECQMR